jgi:hypothetical protein
MSTRQRTSDTLPTGACIEKAVPCKLEGETTMNASHDQSTLHVTTSVEVARYKQSVQGRKKMTGCYKCPALFSTRRALSGTLWH